MPVDVRAASASNIQEVRSGFPERKSYLEASLMNIMVILPKGRSSAARAKVVEIVDQAKKAGVVRKALEQTGGRVFVLRLDRSCGYSR